MTQNDAGKSLVVTASYTDGLGKLETKSSDAVIVANVNDAPIGDVSISGTATQGQTLTASNTLADLDGLGSITYQWLSNGAEISGATQTTYTLTAAEVGKTISVRASYVDLQNTAESKTSDSTALIAAPTNYPPTGEVIIIGTPQLNQVLFANNSLNDANGLGAMSYQWSSNGSPISGATQVAYTTTANDAGKFLTVTASYTDGLGKLESVTSSAVNLAQPQTPPTGNVTISGTPQPNQTLIASNTLADANGLGAMSYQWSANGTAINGATQVAYTTTANDAGKSLTVTASYTDGLGKLENVTSPAVSIAQPQSPPTGNVTISGTPQPNQTLIASNTLADANGLGAMSYQWSANGTAISGATQNNYVLKTDDIGKSISVTASYTDGLNKLESVNSVTSLMVVPTQTPPTGTVTITGKTQPSETLAINNTLADVNGLGTMNYQWLASGVAIPDATKNSYALQAADAGKSISVTASYTDGLGKLESVTSPAVTISQSQMPPTGNITITGKPQPNETLFVNSTLADVNGLGTFNYQWTSNTSPISGANQVAYALTATDAGKNIGVTVSYTDGLNQLETVSSSTVLVVQNQMPPTGKVEISGSPQLNQTLFVNNTLADVNGLGAMNYQWLSNNLAISGANQVVYVVGTADAVDIHPALKG